MFLVKLLMALIASGAYDERMYEVSCGRHATFLKQDVRLP